MTHLYIEQNTGLTEEVNNSIISKLYELAISGDLDETSDLKGRLHTPSARDIHVSYLTTHFPELYITADAQYITLADPDLESFLAGYIGNGETIVQGDIQQFILSGKKFGENYYNPNRGGEMPWIQYDSGYKSVNTFDEFGALFNGLTKIGQNAFCCPNLTSIVIPSTVTEIGTGAFQNTSKLTSLNNLENIQSIGASAFANSHIGGDISLPNLTYIGGSAFTKTKITSISFPATTTLSSNDIFNSCSNLTTITGLSNLTIIPNYTFYKCTQLSNADLDFSIITEIRQGAFQECSLVLPSAFPSLNTLGSGALRETSIQQITDLGNITEIPSDCFRNCTQLTSVQLPSTVTTIKSNAFNGCTNLTSINLSNITTTNGEGQFTGTKLTTVAFNANYQTLSSRIFSDCSNLTTVTGLSNVTTLDTQCFYNCTNLQTIDIDNSKITTLGAQCFQNCPNLSNLVTVNFPNLLTMGMSHSARQQFRECSQIQHVVNLGSITEIGDVYGQGTFDYCTNLQTVTLPETVQTLRYSGLSNCPNVRWVKLLSTSVPFYNVVTGHGIDHSYGTFFGESFRNNDISNEYLGQTYPIYVKDELVNDYKSAAGFSPIAFRIKPLSQFTTDFPNG